MKIQLSVGGLLFLFLITFLPNFLPAHAAQRSLILSTAAPSVKVLGGVAGTPLARVQRRDPYVESVLIRSDIQFRYSRTRVQSVIVNPSDSKSHEVEFNVTLPDTAFISNFSMTIGNETWVAEVSKQEEASLAYDEAKSANKSAGLIETRSANIFTVKSNVEASESITFTLTYDELLQRRLDVYEQTIHIVSDELKRADTYSVTVTVADAQNITMLRAIRGKEGGGTDEEIHEAKVRRDGNVGLMTWSADTKSVGTEIPEKIVLQYQVAHHPKAGQILIRDGHFVHFFSPQTPVESKHIVFVLDISSSMNGTKMRQLKEAMKSILKDLGANHRKDFFNIITFNSDVNVWNGLLSQQANQRLVGIPTTPRNIKTATLFINSLRAHGGANIHAALISALNVTATVASEQQKKPNPILMFVTDGKATDGVTNMDEIQSKIKAANQVQQVPIFCLGFGNDVEFPFLRKLSLQNKAVARKIHEASDSALQLQNFYTEIASPALSNLNITYTSDVYQVGNLTRTKFSRFFRGSEIIVAGKLETDVKELNDPCQSYCVNGNFVPPANLTSLSNSNGTVASTSLFRVVVHGSSAGAVKTIDSADIVLCDKSTTSAAEAYGYADLFDQDEEDIFIERFWAYLTIKQLLEQAEADDIAQPRGGAPDNDNPAQHALDLALRYKFVTPLTSLVVVRENTADEASLPSSKEYGNLIKGLKGNEAVAKVAGDSPAATEREKCQTRRRPSNQNNIFGKIPNTNGPVPTGSSTLLVAPENGTSATPTPVPAPLNLTINDIRWLSADENQIALQNGYETFRVAKDGQADEAPVDGDLCGIGPEICTHLQDCVLPDFIHEFQVYLEDHFCEISASTGHPYAGVCCPATHKVSRAVSSDEYEA